MKKVILPVLFLLITSITHNSHANEHLTLGVGVFEFDGSSTFGIDRDGNLGFGDAGDNRTAEALIEYQGDVVMYNISPLLGFKANADGGLYGYGGIIYDGYVTNSFIISPSISIGGYSEGSSKDLGGEFMFRPALGFNYEFDDKSRIGIELDHLSHANVNGGNNPGSESIFLTYSFPLDLY